jgi:hypothetical protein
MSRLVDVECGAQSTERNAGLYCDQIVLGESEVDCGRGTTLRLAEGRDAAWVKSLNCTGPVGCSQRQGYLGMVGCE